MYRRTSIVCVGAALALSMALLAGCGGVADKEPGSVKYVNSKRDLTESAAKQEYTQRVLYLRDANGLLAPQFVGLPKSNTATKQVLNYLVSDGPVSNALPNGFQATLPADTEVNHVTVDQRGNATADFTKPLLDTPAGGQQQAIQSIVWTLTQFPAVKTVTITVDGKAFTEWPSSKQEVGSGLTRANGINQVYGDVADIAGSEPMTVYYISANNKGKTYDVPVTVRRAVTEDRVTSMVNALVNEPSASEVISPLDPNVRLTEKPKLTNGTVYLHFNDALYDNKKAKTVNDQVLRSLVLTLTGDPAIQKVSIQIGSASKVMLESGKTLSGPVTREFVDAAGV
ncbi:GerMN domain-containing protein [Sporolactobacillus terrae]|uniref:GerMN domain-containing protein n=1 Tax=Sporolactobacillus terrae TaxID=269673 RepID=UPI00049153AF|nr:GerMN domain-containing protein [Sporolactobacillus terrae]